MHKLLVTTALVAGLATSAAAPAHAGWDNVFTAVSNYWSKLTSTSPTTSTSSTSVKTTYVGPMTKVVAPGGIVKSKYPAQTLNLFNAAIAKNKDTITTNNVTIKWKQNANGSPSTLYLNGQAMPGPRTWYDSGTKATYTAPYTGTTSRSYEDICDCTVNSDGSQVPR